MKASAFSDAQKAFILKQGADGVPVAEICRRALDQAGDVLQLEEEVRRPAADGDEAAEAARGRKRAAEEVGGGPVAGPGDATGRDPPKAPRPGRSASWWRVIGVIGASIRRACRVLERGTWSYQYRSRRPDQAGFEARIKAISETRVRYGYRRVHVLLEREGWRINIKKIHRIYNVLGHQLRNRTPKRRLKAKLREDRCEATQPNETWAMDFLHDQLATSSKIRGLRVVDSFSRFSPVIDPRFTYRS